MRADVTPVRGEEPIREVAATAVAALAMAEWKFGGEVWVAGEGGGGAGGWERVCEGMAVACMLV